VFTIESTDTLPEACDETSLPTLTWLLVLLVGLLSQEFDDALKRA
jgi:hypothetical protein